MNEIKKENIITEAEDYEKAYELEKLSKNKGNISFSFFLIIGVAFFTVGLSFLVSDVEKTKSISIPGVAMFAISLYLFYLHLTFRKKVIKRLVDVNLKNEKEFSYTMNIEGLKVVSNDSDSFFEWGYFKYYVEGNGILLLYENDFAHRIFVSKNYTKDEWNLLLEWINLKVKRKIIVEQKQEI